MLHRHFCFLVNAVYLLLAVCLLFLASLYLFLPSTEMAHPRYDSIQAGMTEREVSAALGRPIGGGEGPFWISDDEEDGWVMLQFDQDGRLVRKDFQETPGMGNRKLSQRYVDRVDRIFGLTRR